MQYAGNTTSYHQQTIIDLKGMGTSYFEDMAVNIMEQQIRVRLIGYKAENRWALAYRIRQWAVSYRYCLFAYF